MIPNTIVNTIIRQMMFRLVKKRKEYKLEFLSLEFCSKDGI